MSKANLSKDNPWKIFPAAKTVAYYHPAAQFIELSEVHSTQLKQALSGQNPEVCLQVMPLLFHEIRHWIDHIATVWGQERLISLYNSIHALHTNDPSEFHNIVSFWRAQDRDNCPEYFSTVEQRERPSGAEERWIYSNTSGAGFGVDGRLDESSPIFFTRYNWSTGETAGRFPFSVSALLESSAMHFELATQSLFANQLPVDQQIVESSLFEKKWLNSLYSPDLGIYSTAVHLIANRLKLSRANQAYPLASALASLCLNLTAADFQKLRIPNDFAAWGKRNHAAIERRDRGFAYLVIAFHGDQNHIDDPCQWVDLAAQAAGLPPVSEISKSSRQHMDNLTATALHGPHSKRLVTIIEAGKNLYDAISIIPTVPKTIAAIQQLRIPPVVCADLGWHRIGTPWSINDTNEADRWWNIWCQTETKFTEFIRACGV